MNKRISVVAMAALFMGMSGIVHAETVMGKVVSIDQEGNSLKLVSDKEHSSGTKEYTVVWDKDLAEVQQLRDARIGQIMTMDAEQELVSRNWKVKSVGGVLAIAEKKLLRTDSVALSGEIVEINPAEHWLMLQSKDKDDQGQPVTHRVVWSETNESAAKKLDNAKVGENITVNADQHVITKNWKVTSVAGLMETLQKSDIRTLTGEVRSVDSDKNVIVLYTKDPTGKAGEETVVWSDDFKQQAKLENAKIGDQLSVRADQNMITRHWNVTAIS